MTSLQTFTPSRLVTKKQRRKLWTGMKMQVHITSYDQSNCSCRIFTQCQNKHSGSQLSITALKAAYYVQITQLMQLDTTNVTHSTHATKAQGLPCGAYLCPQMNAALPIPHLLHLHLSQKVPLVPPGQRNEEAPMQSPPPSLPVVCHLTVKHNGQSTKCGKRIFNCESDFRCHVYEVHKVCAVGYGHLTPCPVSMAKMSI